MFKVSSHSYVYLLQVCVLFVCCVHVRYLLICAYDLCAFVYLINWYRASRAQGFADSYDHCKLINWIETYLLRKKECIQKHFHLFTFF